MFDILTVTVNYKMRDKIIAMLRSLFRDVHDTSLKVQPVVVDNASDDGIKEALEREFDVIASVAKQSHGQGEEVATSPMAPRDDMKHQVIFINAGANIGFGRGNNLALKRFDAKYYFIANPDLEFFGPLRSTGQPSASQWGAVENLYKFMEDNPKIGIVAPRLTLSNGAIQPSCMHFPRFFDQPIYRLGLHKKYEWARRRVEFLHMKDFDHHKTQPIDWATGAALFVRGDMFKKAGFFDERYFMYFEDCDLCRTFWARGWPVYYKGDIVIQHGHERASAKVPGLKAVLLNPLTRIHLKSLVQYAWKWRGRG